MDTSIIVAFLQEVLYLIIVFVAFLSFIMYRGSQSVINLILSLYLALLLSLKFPYYGLLLGNMGNSAKSEAVLMILVFVIFMVISKIFFNRMMPPDRPETAFEDFGRKLLYATAATVLVMIYTYHALPITEFIEPGSPIYTLFGNEHGFFWWLLFPLILLFLL